MTNTTTKPVNLANLTEQEISLAEAYAQSAGQDKLISADFDPFLNDGLSEKNSLQNTFDSAKTDFVNLRLDKRKYE